MAHTMDAGGGHRFPGASGGGGGVHENNIVPFVNYRGGKPIPLQVPSKDWQLYGDFDSGPGALRDGPYINKPDEGNTHSLLKQSLDPPPTGYWHMSEDYGDFPYFNA